MNLNLNLSRNFRRFIEQDKKLLVKVIAGVILLAVAFAFYLVKEISEDREMAVTIIPENGVISSMESDGSGVSNDAGSSDVLNADSNLQPTAAAFEEVRTIMVDVAGAVVNPSVVELPEGSRVFEAIEKAGGLTKDADTEPINRALILADGQKIYIPTKQEVKETRNGQPPEAFQYNTGVYDSGAGQSRLININTADSAALQQLTGVGPATAQKIIDYRTENGMFKTVEDIKNVSGIGDKTYEKLKDKITI